MIEELTIRWEHGVITRTEYMFRIRSDGNCNSFPRDLVGSGGSKIDHLLSKICWRTNEMSCIQKIIKQRRQTLVKFFFKQHQGELPAYVSLSLKETNGLLLYC